MEIIIIIRKFFKKENQYLKLYIINNLKIKY
jgi:hypothetical protein